MKTLYRADRLVTRPAGYMRIVTARIGLAIAYSTMFAIAPLLIIGWNVFIMLRDRTMSAPARYWRS